MTFRDTLIGMLGGVSVKQMASFRSIGVQGLGETLNSDDVELIAAYRRNPVVFACVKAKAVAVTDPTVQVESLSDSGTYQVEVRHPLTRLLNEPNPNMSAEQFFRAWMVSREVTGIFYAEIIRSAAGLPAELYPLDPGNVYPVVEEGKDYKLRLIGYEWISGAYRKDIKLENMLVMSDWNLGGTLSPLAVALYHVDNDDHHTDLIRNYWRNAGIPAGILKVKRPELASKMTDQEVEELQDRWQAQYGLKFGRSGKVAVLEEDVDYQKTGMSLNELTSTDLREVDETRICMAMGVPPLIVYGYAGLKRATYSNLDEAWEQFWMTTMSSELKDLRTWLSRTLLKEFESADDVRDRVIRVGWDLTEVGSLQEDVTAAANRELSKWEKGLSTLDEAREAVGLPAHPDPAYGALNVFELRELARALGGTAAVTALDEGIDGGLKQGGLNGRLNEIEYMLSSVGSRITDIATSNGDGDAGSIEEYADNYMAVRGREQIEAEIMGTGGSDE